MAFFRCSLPSAPTGLSWSDAALPSPTPIRITPWPPNPENLTSVSMPLPPDELLVTFPVPVHELAYGDRPREVQVNMVDRGRPRLVPPDGVLFEPVQHGGRVGHLVPAAEVGGALGDDLHEREPGLLQRRLHCLRELVDVPRGPPGDIVRPGRDRDLREVERV